MYFSVSLMMIVYVYLFILSAMYDILQQINSNRNCTSVIMTEINRLLSLRRIEQILNDVRVWMGDNELKVNDDKTVALVLSSRNNRANHNITVIKIGDCDITPSPTGRNIGVIFDTEMSILSHVKHVCCTSYYNLRNIASNRSCFTLKVAVRLV